MGIPMHSTDSYAKAPGWLQCCIGQKNLPLDSEMLKKIIVDLTGVTFGDKSLGIVGCSYRTTIQIGRSVGVNQSK